MSYGLGFYEFFELCEAFDAVAVPVLNAGMTCPIQSRPYIVCPEDSEEFKQTVQDVLDLCEFCRGDETTRWGKVRIDMGHKAPFELKYIAIGNEQWQKEYFSHYARIEEALKEALENGQVSCVAIDVFEDEPKIELSPLLKMIFRCYFLSFLIHQPAYLYHLIKCNKMETFWLKIICSE